MIRGLRPARAVSERPRVLCVDDEPVILRLFERLLAQQGFEPVTSGDAARALALFEVADFDLVITDINMPGMDGHALLRALRERDPELPVVVVTGHGTVDTAIKALREGATGMLMKPFTGEELLDEARNALKVAELRYEALQYRYLRPVLDSIALALSTAIEARHLETGAHCRQLGVLAERTARVLGLNERTQMTVRIGGYLHDIGKIAVPDAILLKPGRLDEAEMAEMRRHSEIGASILEVHEAMADIATIVRHHHERWDGLGYPGGLAGAEIPLGGRIIAVTDAFNAMTTDRVYRPALPIERAWEELHYHSGTQFDPSLVEAFEQVVAEDGTLKPLETDESPPPEPTAIETDRGWLLGRIEALEALAAPVAPDDPVPASDETDAGHDCEIVASGEGCEPVRPLHSIPAAGPAAALPPDEDDVLERRGGRVA